LSVTVCTLKLSNSLQTEFAQVSQVVVGVILNAGLKLW